MEHLPKLNVKTIFDEECSHVRFDAELVKRINEYRIGFENKNEEHMTFFGGNLTGVQVVRFTSQDKEKWFSDVLQIDDITLEERVLQLPVINADFHVCSDIFNISAVWAIHRLMNSPLLNDKQKHAATIDVALSLQYKFLTSLLSNYFKYRADPEIAAATYAQLSMKFVLKQYGSWSATIRARSESLLSPEGIHYNEFKKFDDDIKIVYMLNDTQGRIRDMLKNIVSVFYKIHAQGIRITNTSDSVEFDGEQILKDKTRNLLGYTRYLHSIISDKNSFIKDDLMSIICKVQYTMPSKLLLKTLTWVSSNYRNVGSQDIEELIDLSMTHSFSYLNDHRNLIKETNDLASLISSLRGVYMSSRSTDVELLNVRKKAEEIVIKATGIKNDSVIATIRTGLLMYLVLRAFTMHHYS